MEEREVQDYIYTQKESYLKKLLWYHANQQWLEEQQNKKCLCFIFIGVMFYRERKGQEKGCGNDQKEEEKRAHEDLEF